MLRPVLSVLLCLPAVILLIVGSLRAPTVRPSDFVTDFSARLPTVRQTTALAISLPPAQLPMALELDSWQVALAEPAYPSEAEQAPTDPTRAADAANRPPVDLVQPTFYVRSKPAHPAQVRSV